MNNSKKIGVVLGEFPINIEAFVFKQILSLMKKGYSIDLYYYCNGKLKLVKEAVCETGQLDSALMQLDAIYRQPVCVAKAEMAG